MTQIFPAGLWEHNDFLRSFRGKKFVPAHVLLDCLRLIIAKGKINFMIPAKGYDQTILAPPFPHLRPYSGGPWPPCHAATALVYFFTILYSLSHFQGLNIDIPSKIFQWYGRIGGLVNHTIFYFFCNLFRVDLSGFLAA